MLYTNSPCEIISSTLAFWIEWNWTLFSSWIWNRVILSFFICVLHFICVFLYKAFAFGFICVCFLFKFPLILGFVFCFQCVFSIIIIIYLLILICVFFFSYVWAFRATVGLDHGLCWGNCAAISARKLISKPLATPETKTTHVHSLGGTK